jgi:hypothetical protein
MQPCANVTRVTRRRPDPQSAGCTNSSHLSTHSGADAQAPAFGPVAREDALGQVTTRNPTNRTAGSPKGGGDSPESNKSKLGDCADNDNIDHELPAQGQPLPARAEDEQMVQMRIEQEFVNRVKEGYKKDTELSTLLRDNKYERHADGLHWSKQGQLVIPDYGDLRVECVLAVHTHPYAGHYGINWTLKKAQQVYNWPQMRQTVETVVKECDSCQRVQYVRHKPQGELHPLQIPERRWQSVSMDLITDLPVTKRGHDAVVVFVDRLSKMVHVAPCTKTATAERLAEIFEHEVFKHHGMPTDIVSDRDIRFQSEFWKTVHSRLGIKLSMSTAKHPQTDGQTERANGVLEDTLRHFVGPYQTDWDEYLAVAEFAMNNA